MSISERNRRLYGEKSVAAHYASASKLQPAEETVLGILDGELSRVAMLDIGVGGGRTTVHFAPRVKRYVGIDYSPAMIDAAKARFAGKGYELIHGDARALPFESSSFDVVLFAHNGIDYVDHEDRLQVLREVRRVLWPGGVFVFSTHNLDRRDLDFEPSRDEGIARRIMKAFRRRRFRVNNPGYRAFKEQPHAIVNDGAFGFRAATYHVKPSTQVEQLESVGFERVRVFSGTTGKEIAPACDHGGDPWLYFLCWTR